jgi:hypothetical protein
MTSAQSLSPRRQSLAPRGGRCGRSCRYLQWVAGLLAIVVMAWTVLPQQHQGMLGGRGGGGGASAPVAAGSGGGGGGGGGAGGGLTSVRPKLTRGSQGCVGGSDWFTRRRKALGMRREPLFDLSPAQRAANARVLVISSDTRPLRSSWENRSYASLSMVLNRQYALAHGYDFAFVRTYFPTKPPGLYSEERDAACFHPGYKVWRVHNWCKVLTLWAAATAVEEVPGQGTRPLYDLIVYLDSDAIMQDFSGDISDTWAPHMGSVVFGAPFCGGPTTGGTTLEGCTSLNGTGPLFLFYSDNIPGLPQSPNLGYFAMRNTPRTLSMLRDWWDFVDEVEGHKYAYYAFHEQTGMWKLMGPERGWGGGVTVTDTRWAPDSLAKMIRHINSEEGRYFVPRDYRVDTFSRHAEARSIAGKEYEAAIADTIDSCDAVDLDVLEMVQHLADFPGPRFKG